MIESALRIQNLQRHNRKMSELSIKPTSFKLQYLSALEKSSILRFRLHPRGSDRSIPRATEARPPINELPLSSQRQCNSPVFWTTHLSGVLAWYAN
jgi:hypothetical protein